MKQHLRELHRVVLPLFFMVGAIMMVLFIVFRAGEQWPDYSVGVNPARIGLLRPGREAVFDPTLAVLSPIEMALAPTAVRFDSPTGSEHGAFTYIAPPSLVNRPPGDDPTRKSRQDSNFGDSVYAASDGIVLFAGNDGPEWENVVILLHEKENIGVVKTLYGHLDTIRVAAGGQVRRGQVIGGMGKTEGHDPARFHLAQSPAPVLDLGAGYLESGQGRISAELTVRKGRGVKEDRLSAAPAGEQLEPSSLTLDVETPVEERR